MELTDGAVVREPVDVSKDLVQAGVEVLHAAVDVALLLLDGVQDLLVMEQGVVQTGNTGPQPGDVLVQPYAHAHTHTHHYTRPRFRGTEEERCQHPLAQFLSVRNQTAARSPGDLVSPERAGSTNTSSLLGATCC